MATFDIPTNTAGVSTLAVNSGFSGWFLKAQTKSFKTTEAEEMICSYWSHFVQTHKPQPCRTNKVKKPACSCSLSAGGSVYPSYPASPFFLLLPCRDGRWAEHHCLQHCLNYSTKPESCLSVLTRRDWRNLEEFSLRPTSSGILFGLLTARQLRAKNTLPRAPHRVRSDLTGVTF